MEDPAPSTPFSVEMLEQLFGQSPDGVYLLSPIFESDELTDFRFDYCNKQGALLLDLPVEALLNKHLCVVLPINRTGGFFDFYKDIWYNPRIEQSEFFIPASSPGSGWWENIMTPTQVGLLSQLRKISKYKRMESRLQESEERLKAVMDSLSIGLAITNTQGTIILENRPLEQMFKLARHELIGRNIEVLIPEAYAQHHHEHMEAYLSKGPGASSTLLNKPREFVVQDKHGSSFPIELLVKEISAEDERLFIGLFTDLSERKVAETERLNHAKELLRLQGVGNLGLTAAGLTHDFNNLLSVIIGNVELALSIGEDANAADDFEIKDQLNSALEAASTASQLINRVRTLSRVRPQAPAEVDVALVVKEVADLATRILRPALPIQVEIDPGDHTLKLAASDLHHLLFNLIKNSHDADPEAQITVSLKKKDSCIAFVVADNGPGFTSIPTFEELQPADREGNGMGIGLFLVRQAAQRLGGVLHARNLPEGGAEVSIEIKTRVETGGGAVETVLVVEDEPALANSLVKYLRNRGFRVTHSETVSAARDAIDSQSFDLILTDYNLPDGQGTQLLRPGRRDILMSGWLDESPFQDENEKWRYLQKPFSLSKLLELIAQGEPPEAKRQA